MANQSEMLARLRALYMPRAINIADMAARVEACAAYWQLLSPAQRNAIAMLNKDAAIWKAAWDAQQQRIDATWQQTEVQANAANETSQWRPCETQGDLWEAPERCEVVGVFRRTNEPFNYRWLKQGMVADISGACDFFWRPWTPPPSQPEELIPDHATRS